MIAGGGVDPTVSSVSAEELAAVNKAKAGSTIDENIRQFVTEPTNDQVGRLIDAGVLRTKESAVILQGLQDDGYLANRGG